MSAFPLRRNSERLRSDMEIASDPLSLADSVLAVVIIAYADAKDDVALLDGNDIDLDGVFEDASQTHPACCRVALNRGVDYFHAGAMNLVKLVRHLLPPSEGTLTRTEYSLGVLS